MNQSLNQFFDKLDLVMPYISGVLLTAGLGIFFGYLIRQWSIKNLKEKYDFISVYDIRILWNCGLLLIVAIALFPKHMISGNLSYHHILDYLIELVLALILGTVLKYLLKYYHPNYINRKLKNLRYKARISPKTGKPMKLLTEEEEDVYLDEGMQAEEDVFSIDYDVWIDEETGYTQIEKYSGKHSAKTCPRCGYHTLKVEKEELIIAPTQYSSGELMKRYKCTYCGHKEKEIFTVAKLKEET